MYGTLLFEGHRMLVMQSLGDTDTEVKNDIGEH